MTMKKISTEYQSVFDMAGSEEKALYEIASVGFDAYDFSMTRNMAKYDSKLKQCVPINHPLAGPDYMTFVKKMRRIATENGLVCNQSHAPFPVKAAGIRSMLCRSLECTAELGGKICVIHPDNDKSAEENAEMYFELLPYAKEFGVKIATENMWNWDKAADHATTAACSHHDDFLAHIKAVNDPYLVACVDVGHAEMQGLNTNAATMIRTLGSSVQALHLHDVDLHHDNHYAPFTLKIDYEPIIRALKEIDYQGDMTLEACYYLKKEYTPENYMEGLRIMASGAKRLAQMYEDLVL